MSKERSIQQHINDDKDLLDNATLSPQMRRHTEDELHHLELYQAAHPDDDMIQPHLKCIVTKTQKQTNAGFMRTDGRRSTF